MDDEYSDIEIELIATPANDPKIDKNPLSETYHLQPLFHGREGRLIYICPKVYASLWDHAFSSRSREVGGVLLGNPVQSGDHILLMIKAFLDAKHTDAGQARITFTHRTWMDINERIRIHYPDIRMLGWYHTHPGYGVFLSERDLFIQRNFFNGCYQVALVIDPLRGEDGFFYWEGAEIRRTRRVFLFGKVKSDIDNVLQGVVKQKNQHKSKGKGTIEQVTIKENKTCPIKR